jgi:hypothetical protein
MTSWTGKNNASRHGSSSFLIEQLNEIHQQLSTPKEKEEKNQTQLSG